MRVLNMPLNSLIDALFLSKWQLYPYKYFKANALAIIFCFAFSFLFWFWVFQNAFFQDDCLKQSNWFYKRKNCAWLVTQC